MELEERTRYSKAIENCKYTISGIQGHFQAKVGPRADLCGKGIGKVKWKA